MKTVFILVSLVFITLISPGVIFAVEANAEISNYTSSALNIFTIIGSLLSTFFIIAGGYSYLTSQGRPDSLEHAKKTIRNAVIGLVLILSANSFVSFLNNSFSTPSIPINQNVLSLTPIQPIQPQGGLAQVLVDSIGALIQNIVQSATKPITDALLSYLSITPAIATNSVIFNFWLIIVGIADALFALVIALLGLHFMSASTFGFEEVELKKILPRLAFAFLGANTSIFLVDGIVSLSNALISAVLHATGGLNQIWVTSAFNPAFLSLDRIAFITLIFMLLFVIISVVLLLFYISRLIIIAVGAVLSPLLFLLWALPRFSDFVEISFKSYLMTIFSVFVHIVVIQLSASFLNLSAQSGTNSFLSILVGIGLLLTLLKTQTFMIQLMFYNSGRSMVKKVSGQILNVISNKERTPQRLVEGHRVIKTPRKVVHA